MRSGNAIFAALGVLLAAALVAGEGRSFWVGSAALVAAALALGAALLGLAPRPVLTRAGVVAVSLLAAFVLWSGASILWSEAPDRSWEFFNRGLVYLAFLALGLFVARRPFAELLAGLLGALIAWALVAKVFALDDGRRARLNEPVGYWNTLGLLAASAVPLALRLASRTLSALLLYGAVVAILLTQSRGGLLLATLAGALWLVLERERYEPALRLAVAVPPGLVVGVLGLALDGVAEDAQPHSERLADGLLLGLALVLGGALVAGLARLEVSEQLAAAGRLRRRPGRRRSPFSSSASGRARLLRPGHAREPVAAGRGELEQSRAVVGGGGARLRGQPGRRATARRRSRSRTGATASRTSRCARRTRCRLQLLTETGLVGFALFAGAAVAAALAIRRERALVLVLALFAVGVLYDIHWDFTAAGAVAFATLGVLLPRGERVGRPRAALGRGRRRARARRRLLARGAVARRAPDRPGLRGDRRG